MVLAMTACVHSTAMAQDAAATGSGTAPAAPQAAEAAAQPAEAEPGQPADTAGAAQPDGQPPAGERATELARDLAADAEQQVGEVARRIDQNATARDAAAGILQPIYVIAEALAFPAFYWLAFALMAAGTVSYALQLLPGKLVLLLKGSLNLREILSDAISLVISLCGLVLTTQAATENSSFTQSPAAVLSACVVGGVLGIAMYRWGQTQELRAVDGRRLQPNKPKA